MSDSRSKTCPACKQDKTYDAFQLNPDGSIRKHICKACYAKKYRVSVKFEAIIALGSMCACCGEEHPAFLSLDHINNDGAEHRAQYSSSNNSLIYADARREGWPTDRYQLLCYNCQSAKNYQGVCPHRVGETAKEALDEMRAITTFKTGKQYQNMNLEPLKLGPLSQKGIRRPSDPAGQVAALLQQLSPEDLATLLARYSKS